MEALVDLRIDQDLGNDVIGDQLGQGFDGLLRSAIWLCISLTRPMRVVMSARSSSTVANSELSAATRRWPRAAS